MSILLDQTGWRGSKGELKPQLSQELFPWLGTRIKMRQKGLIGTASALSFHIIYSYEMAHHLMTQTVFLQLKDIMILTF